MSRKLARASANTSRAQAEINVELSFASFCSLLRHLCEEGTRLGLHETVHFLSVAMESAKDAENEKRLSLGGTSSSCPKKYHL